MRGQDWLSSDFLYKASLFVTVIIFITSAWNAPLSGDEYVHVKQAEKNINYFKTLGHDKSALETPISRLKHYGQSFDNFTTLLTQVFSIENQFRFRHVANSLVAWLIVVFTSMVTIQLSRSKWAGMVTIVLILLTARFMGHAMNNLKDIPFALSFIFTIYFTFRFLDQLPRFSWMNIAFVILGIASGISIRIGGLLIYAYFLLFSMLWIYYSVQGGSHIVSTKWILKYTGIAMLVLIMGYFLGILFWPWAWEGPLTNPLESLALMKNYPTTVRQIFEGQLFWSDQFPWYYLFKYLLITLPLIALLGFMAFFVFMPRRSEDLVKSIFLLIAFGFPVFYASVTGANVYGGWRQMLFVFPPFIVLSTLGIWRVLCCIKSSKKWIAFAYTVLVISMIYPAYYSISNYPYQYTFFNVLQGGFKGAYGHYELDYYFTGFKKAYQFIDEELAKPEIVATNFIIPEYYRDKSYQSRLINYYDRSIDDWDYAVVCNTFLHPFQLQNNIWPPENSIFEIEIEGKSILAILERKSKKDFEGIQLLKAQKYKQSIKKLEEALISDPNNESILVNLARANSRLGNFSTATNILDRLLTIYPDNEWALDLKGEMLMDQSDYAPAKALFRKNIENNYKFFHSYVNLAKAQLASDNEEEAVQSLKKCLRLNPFYKPAYQLYGNILIGQGEVELGRKMLNYKIEGNSKYGMD